MAGRLLHSTARLAPTAAVLLATLTLVALALGPRTGRYQTLTMLSGSMRPAYPPGALLLDAPEPLSALRVGQVLTYQIPVLDQQVESHRVVAVRRHPDGSADVQTRGDANAQADPWLAHLSPGQQVWTVRAAVPGAGRLLLLLREPAARGGLQYAMPAALLGWLLLGLWRPNRALPIGQQGDRDPAESANVPS